jgi:N-acetylglutamate synthase-like GNAT family acetyltransferase
MIQIRPAKAAEQDTIRHIVRLVGLPPYSLKWQHFLVAEQDGQVIGVGQIRQHGGYNELGSLAVLPEQRGQGVAAQLITGLEAKAGMPLYLFCRDNLESYYERFGYRRIRFPEAPGPLKSIALLAFTVPRLLFGFRILIMRKDSQVRPA